MSDGGSFRTETGMQQGVISKTALIEVSLFQILSLDKKYSLSDLYMLINGNYFPKTLHSLYEIGFLEDSGEYCNILHMLLFVTW